MHARIASFENQDYSRLDELAASGRQGLQAVPGLKGALFLADRSGGRGLGIALFDNAEAVEAAGPAFEQMGDEIPEDLRGRRTGVEVHEVFLNDGARGAAAARVSSLQGSPEAMEAGMRYAIDTVMPKAREIPGYVGALAVGNRQTGATKVITLWDSQDSMRASEEAANQLRQEAADAAHENVTGVDRYEVAHADLGS